LLYYVMPFVEGESLNARLTRDKHLPIQDAVAIAREVAEALDHAHSHGIVHRDIKPENILLYGGHAVIADFGIAKALSAAGAAGLTGTGFAIGTPAYMSPEQATADEVDVRSDVYALGCVLYEMLVGTPPFSGATPAAVIQQQIVATPPAPSDRRPAVSPELNAIVLRAMAKSPGDRFPSAGRLAEALAEAGTTPSRLFPAILARRVPQVLVAYGVLIGLVFWGLKVIVNRIVWSPHLPAFGLAVLALLMPAVGIVAYHRRGGASWRTALGNVGVAANAVAAALILGLSFGTTDLGAATTEVTVTDEEGKSVSRVVPKAEFRKNVLIFPFDNRSGDSAIAWLEHGLPLGLDVDLEQDMFVQISTSDALVEEFKKRNYPTGRGIPFTLKRELAGIGHMPLFVTGSYAQANGQLEVTVGLYETRRGKLVAERSYSGAGTLPLIDQITAQLKQDLGLPAQHLENTEDLAVADQLTPSTEAFRLLSEAYRLVTFDRNWQGASVAAAAAVSLDSTNAYAHLLHYALAMMGNDRAGAERAIESAMRHSYKLPERTRYQVKFQYYDFTRQAEKSLAVAEMRVELFPDDVEGRTMLGQAYLLRNRFGDAMEQLEAVLRIDPSRTEVLNQLGSLARGQGNLEAAEGYFQRYADAHPDDYRSYPPLASLQRLQGRFDAARATYEKAQLLEPGNVSLMASLAGLERHFGRPRDEITQLQLALEKAKTTLDSFIVLEALQNAHEYQGQIERAIQHLERRVVLAQRLLPPMQVLNLQLQNLDTYVKANQTEKARTILAGVERQLQPPFLEVGGIGHLAVALEAEDPAGAEQAIPRIEAFMQAFGAQVMVSLVLHAKGRVLEMRGECGKALEQYRAELADNPTNLSIHQAIGRCQRQLGQLDDAEASLRKSLVSSPHNPRVHYELALVEAARGNRPEAVEHLQEALRVWSDADTGYRHVQLARTKLSELQ
jgi:tetratricopeptide (TPR) repeat protein